MSSKKKGYTIKSKGSMAMLNMYYMSLLEFELIGCKSSLIKLLWKPLFCKKINLIYTCSFLMNPMWSTSFILDTPLVLCPYYFFALLFPYLRFLGYLSFSIHYQTLEILVFYEENYVVMQLGKVIDR